MEQGIYRTKSQRARMTDEEVEAVMENFAAQDDSANKTWSRLVVQRFLAKVRPNPVCICCSHLRAVPVVLSRPAIPQRPQSHQSLRVLRTHYAAPPFRRRKHERTHYAPRRTGRIDRKDGTLSALLYARVVLD